MAILTMARSIVLDSTDVIDIDLQSPGCVGLDTLGIGLMMAVLNCRGD